MSKDDKDIIERAFSTDDLQELEMLVRSASSITAKTIIREFIEELEINIP